MQDNDQQDRTNMNLETNIMEAIKIRFREVFGESFKPYEPMAKYTSARVGGMAEMFVMVRNVSELVTALELAYLQQIPYTVIGGGSNILVSDNGIKGLVILNKAKEIHFRHTGLNVVCSSESGANLSSLARQCIAKGLGGLEWAVSVPGTVGGAVYGNAGAHGGDIAGNLLSATIWEPGSGISIYSNDEMQFGYRESVLKKEKANNDSPKVVLSCELQLKPEPVDVLVARADGFVAKRKESQPGGASVGSMFKNPENYYAGYLIEAAGLKGFRSGGAHISEKHANFFVNDADATAEDIRALLAEAWNTVRDQFGVELETEVELVGDWKFEDESDSL